MPHTLKNLGLIVGFSLFVASTSHADSLQNMSEAVGDSADASARIVASGGQVVLGAVAVPLSLVGAGSEGVGSVTNDIAGDLWSAANAPLTIDDAIVIADPAPQVPAEPQSPAAPQEETSQ